MDVQQRRNDHQEDVKQEEEQMTTHQAKQQYRRKEEVKEEEEQMTIHLAKQMHRHKEEVKEEEETTTTVRQQVERRCSQPRCDLQLPSLALGLSIIALRISLTIPPASSASGQRSALLLIGPLAHLQTSSRMDVSALTSPSTGRSSRRWASCPMAQSAMAREFRRRS